LKKDLGKDNNKNNNSIYIGDNLAILTSPDFIEKYKDKVSFIYIDPPYNTQSKLSYNDTMNSENWGDFMRKRLEASYQFLTSNGVIFISIDDNEYASLKIICDKIYGKENFIGTFITKQSQRSNAKLINIVHEYVLCFAKDISKVKRFEISRMEIPEDGEMIYKLYSEITSNFLKNGYESSSKLLKKKVLEYCSTYEISWLKNYNTLSKTGKILYTIDLSTPGTPRRVDIDEINLHLDPLPTRGWSSDEKFKKLYYENRLSFKDNRPYEIQYLEESRDNAPSILNYYSRQGTSDLNKLGLNGLFDTPKPVDMIKYFIKLATSGNDIVLDFFAGSGTTAQAVYETNKIYNLNNSYCLIQLDEPINKSSESFETCKKLGIEPTVSNVLIHRITKYLEINGLDESFFPNIIYKLDINK
jgi:adenine-specific DNA-methyltransferase